MAIARVSKMIAGAGGGLVAGTGTAVVLIPEGVEAPWWGYVLVGVINAAIVAAAVYRAPANLPARSRAD